MADINTGGDDVKDSAAIQRAKEALAKNAVSLAVALNESTADDNDSKNTIQSAAAVRGKKIKTEPEVAVTCVKKGRKRHQTKEPKLEQQVEKNIERPEKRVKIDEEDDEEEEDKDDISHDEDDKDENDEEEKEENEEKEEEDDEDDDEDEEDNKDNIPRFREVYARTMDDDELSDEDERIFLRFSGNNLKWGSRRERTIRVMEYAALSTYFERYANSIGVSVYSLRFFCDGCRLDGDRAAADYGLNEGDIVEVFEMQTGGHCH